MANTAHTFEKYKPEYERLIKTLVVRPHWKPIIEAAAKKIAANESRYKEVQDATGVPWRVVGAIHWLECGGSFNGHLHNGDSLKKRTWQVPKGMPKHKGSNPDGSYTWLESAIDALEYDGLTKVKDWSDERVAFLLEKYNGWGYRKLRVNSPYLWSGSTHYTRGKYIADGKYDAGAVSQQTGAMLLYLRLGQLEAAEQPATTTREETKELKKTSKGFWLTRWVRDFYRFLVPSGAGLAATLESVRDFFTSWQGLVTIGIVLFATLAVFEYLDYRKRKDYAEGRHIPSGEVEDAGPTVETP